MNFKRVLKEHTIVPYTRLNVAVSILVATVVVTYRCHRRQWTVFLCRFFETWRSVKNRRSKFVVITFILYISHWWSRHWHYSYETSIWSQLQVTSRIESNQLIVNPLCRGITSIFMSSETVSTQQMSQQKKQQNKKQCDSLERCVFLRTIKLAVLQQTEYRYLSACKHLNKHTYIREHCYSRRPNISYRAAVGKPARR